MNQFYPIIILTNNKDLEVDNNYLLLNNNVFLTNNTTINYNNQEISFDYLIFDNTSLIINFDQTNILHDNKIPVTNFFYATSVDNIFFTSNIIEAINNIENEEF